MLRLLRSRGMMTPRQAGVAAVGAGCPRRFRFMSTAVLPYVDSPVPPCIRPLPLTDDERAILQDRLGYTFRRPELLQHALTHPSHPDCDHEYERFKEIGERILLDYLGIIVSPLDTYPSLVGLNVSPNKLARSAIRLGLYNFLRHNDPKLHQEVKEFTDEQLGRILYRGIPCSAPTLLADLVQVIFGAVVVDFGFEEYEDFQEKSDAWEVDFEFEEYEDFQEKFVAWEKTYPHIEPIFSREGMQHRHIVTTLECICHDYRMSLDFKSMKEDTLYTTQVFINNILHGSASYTVESDAKGIATLDALNNLPMYMLIGTTVDTAYKMKQKLRSSFPAM